MVFYQFIFGTPMVQKKIQETFFLSKSKIRKSKKVYNSKYIKFQNFINIKSQNKSQFSVLVNF